MIETILALLAACITIYISGLLVRKQNKIQEETKELANIKKNSLEEIEEEVKLLLNEDTKERTLSYLETRMESLNKCLSIVKNPKYRDRRNNNVKRKKHFTDD